MWERSGGNKGMVDQLVCDWNTANAGKPINLSYIPHAEMVGKIAQGIATGDVPGPDGHGPDLRPAVRERRPARRPDRQDQGLARAHDGEPRPHDRRDVQRQAVRRPAVRRRVGPVLQQGPVHEGRPRPEQAADEPGRAPRVRRQDHGARRRHQGLLPARQLRRLQHLHGRPADVGVRTRRSRPASAATSRSTGDGVKEVLQWTARHGQGRQRPRERPVRERRHVPPPVRLRQDRDDGHRQLQHHARQRPDEGPRHVRVRHQPAAGQGRRARPPRSSAATSSSSRTAATASTTRSSS